MRIVLVTNIPSPYRVLQFDKVAEKLGDNFCVFYCARITSIRKWKISELKHKHIFLKKSKFENKWFNSDIVTNLKIFNPDIIITSGFFPTSMLAFFYAKIHKKKHIVFTDSWVHSVNKLTFFHRLLRKIVIPRSDAFICVGKKGKDFLEKFGAVPEKIFVSPLAIDNDYYSKFANTNPSTKKYDIIFSGQFVERKMPNFILNVLIELYKIGHKLKFLMIGSGELKEKIISILENNNIDYLYPGFIHQEELPKYYSNSKLLLFPSKDDPWGLVANEACAVGTPVITCDNTGVAGDLIIDNYNGYILPLEEEAWVDKIKYLLSNQNELERLSKNAVKMVQKFSIENAAIGIIKACNYVKADEK